jgi:hypothetical protein
MELFHNLFTPETNKILEVVVGELLKASGVVGHQLAIECFRLIYLRCVVLFQDLKSLPEVKARPCNLRKVVRFVSVDLQCLLEENFCEFVFLEAEVMFSHLVACISKLMMHRADRCLVLSKGTLMKGEAFVVQTLT